MRNPDGNYRNSNTLRTSEYMVSLKTYTKTTTKRYMNIFTTKYMTKI